MSVTKNITETVTWCFNEDEDNVVGRT